MNIKKIKQILKNKFNNDFIEVIDINGQENHFSIIEKFQYYNEFWDDGCRVPLVR